MVWALGACSKTHLHTHTSSRPLVKSDVKLMTEEAIQQLQMALPSGGPKVGVDGRYEMSPLAENLAVQVS